MSQHTRKITVNIPEDLYIQAAAHKAISRVDIQDAVAEGLRLYLAKVKNSVASLQPQPQIAN